MIFTRKSLIAMLLYCKFEHYDAEDTLKILLKSALLPRRNGKYSHSAKIILKLKLSMPFLQNLCNSGKKKLAQIIIRKKKIKPK